MVDYIKAGIERARVQAEATKAERTSKPKVPTWTYVLLGVSLVTLIASWAVQPETPEARLARERQREQEWTLIVLSCEAQSQSEQQATACVALASQGLQERH
jgi:hypothetical protein